VISIVKGASAKEVDLPGRVLGAALLCKSARLKPVVSTLASAEFQDMAPGLYAAAVSQTGNELEKLAYVGGLMHATLFRPELSKEASSLGGVAMEQLQSLLTDRHPAALEDALQTDAGGVMAEESEEDGSETLSTESDVTSQVQVDDVINKGKEDDAVDEFMAFDTPQPAMAVSE